MPVRVVVLGAGFGGLELTTVLSEEFGKDIQVVLIDKSDVFIFGFSKLDGPAKDSVAEHDQVSEVYHIVDGTATLVLGPDITNRQRRPATLRTVVEFNGPGNNGSEIRDGVTYHVKPGDVVVIPAGTGHLFTKIDDHIDYLMVRIDPDKVTPVKSETASKEYLSKPAPRGQ